MKGQVEDELEFNMIQLAFSFNGSFLADNVAVLWKPASFSCWFHHGADSLGYSPSDCLQLGFNKEFYNMCSYIL